MNDSMIRIDGDAPPQLHNVAIMPISSYNTLKEKVAACESENASLRAENEALREALRPFARAAEVRLCGDWKDSERFGRTDVQFYLTFGDLRRARTAYEGGESSLQKVQRSPVPLNTPEDR